MPAFHAAAIRCAALAVALTAPVLWLPRAEHERAEENDAACDT